MMKTTIKQVKSKYNCLNLSMQELTKGQVLSILNALYASTSPVADDVRISLERAVEAAQINLEVL
jgi:hypothetical protein